MDIKTRIGEVRRAKSLKLKDFSDQLGVNYQTIQRYFSGERAPSVEFLAALSTQMDISANWLLTGRGTMDISNSVEGRGDSQFVAIPLLEISASAGSGTTIDQEKSMGSYSFSTSWLKRKNLNPKTLSVIEVKGDSMEPDLYDKDLILLNHQIDQVEDSSIYVVRFSGGLFVKRVQQHPFGKIRLLSTNKTYDPIEIRNPKEDGLDVVGHVVASMHEW